MYGEEGSEHLEGRLGRVTVPIPVGKPGEVMVETRGGTERFAAWSESPLRKYAPVVIVAVRSARSVDVAPFPEAEDVVRH